MKSGNKVVFMGHRCNRKSAAVSLLSSINKFFMNPFILGEPTLTAEPPLIPIYSIFLIHIVDCDLL